MDTIINSERKEEERRWDERQSPSNTSKAKVNNSQASLAFATDSDSVTSKRVGWMDT